MRRTASGPLDGGGWRRRRFPGLALMSLPPWSRATLCRPLASGPATLPGSPFSCTPKHPARSTETAPARCQCGSRAQGDETATALDQQSKRSGCGRTSGRLTRA